MVLWAITLFFRCVDKPIVEAQLDLIQRLGVDRLPSLDWYHLLGANWESQAFALSAGVCSKAYSGILGNLDDKIAKLLYLAMFKSPPNQKT